MIAWLAARCDGADYGHLFEFAFSKDRNFYGPGQVQATINQDPEISRQISLWNQMGSKVILGNLLVIPVEDSLLYVEPLYIAAENGQLPQLQRVLASYDGKAVMGDDLEATLAALFKAPAAQPPVVAKNGSAENVIVAFTKPTQPVTGGALHANGPPSLQAAAAHYNQALTALRRGDWAQFGAEMQKLGTDLGQPGDSIQH
jgi:uncharacterized membrane protein (UPF0182 family)